MVSMKNRKGDSGIGAFQARWGACRISLRRGKNKIAKPDFAEIIRHGLASAVGCERDSAGFGLGRHAWASDAALRNRHYRSAYHRDWYKLS